MNTELIIKEIIKIPKTYHELKEKSYYTLLKETGYFEEFQKIDEKKIFKELKKYPEFVKYWLQWSDDQRVTEGYFIGQKKNRNYYVLYYIQNTNYRDDEIEFTNASEACAYFIKHDIERVRKNDILTKKKA